MITYVPRKCAVYRGAVILTALLRVLLIYFYPRDYARGALGLISTLTSPSAADNSR